MLDFCISIRTDVVLPVNLRVIIIPKQIPSHCFSDFYFKFLRSNIAMLFSSPPRPRLLSIPSHCTPRVSRATISGIAARPVDNGHSKIQTWEAASSTSTDTGTAGFANIRHGSAGPNRSEGVRKTDKKDGRTAADHSTHSGILNGIRVAHQGQMVTIWPYLW